MFKRLNFNFFVQPVVQVVLIVVVAVMLYAMSWVGLNRPSMFDPQPDLGQKELLTTPVQIKTGLFINNFLNFDLVKNDFVISGTVWFEFDSKQVTLEQLEQSVFSKGKLDAPAMLHGRAKPLVETRGDKTFAQYQIQVKFTSNLDHSRYPFDSHRLYLTLNNPYLDSHKYRFVSDPTQLMISNNAHTPGWKMIGKQVQTGQVSKKIGSGKEINYPRVIYSVDFVRDSFKDILLLILPLIVALFMAMFVFSYDRGHYESGVLSVSGTTVGAMVGYRFVINNVAPHVPYFMLIDHLFNLFLLLAFVVFLFNVFNLLKRSYSGLMILAMHAVLLGGWGYLLFFWHQ